MNHSPRRRCESLHEQGEIGHLREETVEQVHLFFFEKGVPASPSIDAYGFLLKEQVHLDGCQKKESNMWILYGKSSLELVRSQAS
jgi:hypothetical protein